MISNRLSSPSNFGTFIFGTVIFYCERSKFSNGLQQQVRRSEIELSTLSPRTDSKADLFNRSPKKPLHSISTIQSSPLLPRSTIPKAKQTPAFKKLKARVRLAHGVTMGLAFIGFYPLAALMMRLFNFRYIVRVHVAMQVLAMLLMYAGMALGIWFANYDDKLFEHKYPSSVHTRMGVAIPALMLLQPMLGWLHHEGYVNSGGRTVWMYLHANYGRALIFLGGVNGIIGRVNEKGDYLHGQTIFATLFSIVAFIYAVVWSVTAVTRRRKAKGQPNSPSSPVEEIREEMKHKDMA
ncbi:hypothetical protein BT63DRAFT_182779 [Microthyrium microscopicum]|uniref:Cytochrome b561 domain-containing protein n=1 Tax=Microthyrium microscopicum TaxID=703497 RepID=A0A6A6ULC0_9PEZI|nr:hypothetical protein BT63DRAFT_182779 [Microthyrium microscopicum]